ncbi:G2/mitotic-specific cyclin [Podila humilis]|nr:G2/mitotic-specific cyclin [Podila humilis]
MFAARNDSIVPRVTKPALTRPSEGKLKSMTAAGSAAYGTSSSRILRRSAKQATETCHRPALSDITEYIHTNSPPKDTVLERQQAKPTRLTRAANRNQSTVLRETSGISRNRTLAGANSKVDSEHDKENINVTEHNALVASHHQQYRSNANTGEQTKVNNEKNIDSQQHAETNSQSKTQKDVKADNTELDSKPQMKTTDIFPRKLLTEDEYRLNVEYSNIIFGLMKEQEVLMRVPLYYLETFSEQFWHRRKDVVNFLSEAWLCLEVHHEVIFLAVNMMDRILAAGFANVHENRMLLTGVLCLFMAGKFEDGIRIRMDLTSVRRLIHHKGLNMSVDQLREHEWELFRKLDFNIAWPGPLVFLRRGSRADDENAYARLIAKYLLELMLLEKKFIEYVPSLQAASALYVSRIFLSRSIGWSKLLTEYTGYDEPQLRILSLKVVEYLTLDKIAGTAVFRRYMSRDRYCIAQFVAHGAEDAQYTEAQIAFIKTKFEEVDTDKNGSINLDELTTLLKTLGGGESSAKISIRQFDQNQDGRLTFDEFLELAPTIADWNLQVL